MSLYGLAFGICPIREFDGSLSFTDHHSGLVHDAEVTVLKLVLNLQHFNLVLQQF